MAGKKRKASGAEGRKEDAKRQATESASGSTPATAGQASKNAAVGATMVEASQGRANVNYVARFFDYKERLHKANSKRDGYHDALRRSMTKHCDLQEEIDYILDAIATARQKRLGSSAQAKLERSERDRSKLASALGPAPQSTLSHLLDDQKQKRRE
ncbi:hypothetical protein CBOM_02177 [Ceraceosorus bombacis]|uniref:Uncharacterized protein n=1 Tax=Ceraceosorus bombacis TaxID=401625 RepID=A0A0P1BEM3_9BASI|nr:hypothetical protein CBOM_02177 [Ceraceosorus bombacis]